MRALLLAVALATPLVAAAQVSQMRPRPRPALPPVVQVAPVPANAASVRPRARPAGLVPPPPVAAAAQPLPTGPIPSLLRPRHRPETQPDLPLETALAAPSAAPKQSRRKKAALNGSVCGDPAIRGEELARITSKVKGCGIAEPVRVTEIDGIRLSQPATIDCGTATALRKWIDGAMRPAFGRREVVQLNIAAHYICRPMNNVKGAKVSEHGRGKAIDISGFVFADGSSWSVLGDYNAQIRKAHKGACGVFGTTLGPGSDGYHEDHLHFDTASRSYGAYCR